MESVTNGDRGLLALAAAQVERKQDLAIHVAAYLSVNFFLIVLWAVADGGAFWPIVPIVAWGLALALHGWSVFGRPPISAEDRIGREAERLRARRADRR
jgi:hypothetical protein